ncbi:medium-chain fatty acid-CoA ligase faa2 [Aspergillus melleus]|uniref:medium-chain fatty acid-CoA ligase faa2 n=1 Tax=Aspergillus melleus TaxID=138277 RepID=UPI001E8DBD5F|nr:medium-chain fatty acid-CoA ligase faa2 [Aspergillus melleus]KAH8430384.1 medium-chain fatty acid-CoA ligase faa2 [Aspergillus melleus]
MLFAQQPLHLARADELRQEPPKGTPYSVALPGTEKPGRSKIYRAHSAQKGLVKTLDPQVCAWLAPPGVHCVPVLTDAPFQVLTAHDAFESTANRVPKNHCLGWRPYNQDTKTFGSYQWIDYQTVQQRRSAFGAGLVELHLKHDCHRPGQYGVGLWCQNRPEWQITGMVPPFPPSMTAWC